LLAGDAAHVHSPADGQGMNETRLDQYERTRRPIAERVVAFTDRMTRMATLRTPRGRTVRNAVMRVIGRIPAVRHRLAIELAGLRNR
jgi:2-polyprenyl-6-methoxyphenol hydroxylase-like FAD-dependent oxidoreductase